MTQPTLFGAPADGPCGTPTREAISMVVRWDWEHDTKSYWLSHGIIDTPTNERLVWSSNRFTWKPVDAAGDAGLVVRWIREARCYLATPELIRDGS